MIQLKFHSYNLIHTNAQIENYRKLDDKRIWNLNNACLNFDNFLNHIMCECTAISRFSNPSKNK